MIPLVPSLVGLAAAVVLSFASGYKVRGDAEKARQLDVERGWHEKYKQGVAEAQAAADTAGVALRAELAARADDIARARAELATARRAGTVRLSTCVPASAARGETPAVVASNDDSRVSLTPEFRLRFSESLSIAVPSRNRSEWVATASALTDPIGLWEVLENITENSSRWGQCISQLEGWIAFAAAKGWK